MKLILQVEQEATNAIKFLIGIALLALTIYGCKVNTYSANSPSNPDTNSTFEVQRLETRSGDGKICKIELYDYDDKSKRFPFSFAIVNGISIRDSVFRVATETKTVDIKIYQVLHDPIFIDNLVISTGDSLVVRAFLKESNWIME